MKRTLRAFPAWGNQEMAALRCAAGAMHWNGAGAKEPSARNAFCLFLHVQ